MEPKQQLSKNPDESAEKPDALQMSLFQKSTVFYSVFAAIGLATIIYGHKTFPAVIAIPSDPKESLKFLAISLLGAGVLLIFSYLFEDLFPSYKAIKNAVVKLLGRISIPMAVYLAFISAIGEELLFRGAIQPYAGLVFTAVLFGLLHMGPGGGISSWSLWAIMAGLLLGWMYESTQSLWPPVLCHFTVNAFSLIMIRQQTKNPPASHDAKSPNL